ncbi:MAG: hypothetical protein KDD70_10305 [Bdellovibrionales bacterium]|nr:hypothetical protein [Bdellovibrionales bacterium]
MAPLSGVLVTDLNTGTSDISDDAGNYSVRARAEAGDIRLGVDTSNFSDTVQLNQIAETTRLVKVDLVVFDEDENIEPGEIFESETDDEEEGEDNGAKSSSSEESNEHESPTPTLSGGGVGSSSPSASPVASPTSTGTPSPTVSSTPAQTPAPSSTPQESQEVEREGILSALSETSLTVSGVVFEITSETTFRDRAGHVVAQSQFSTGERVEVRGIQLSPTAPPLALVVTSKEESSGEHENGEDVEAEGAIQAITASSITVRGVQFSLTSSTTYLDKNEHHVTLSHFQVDDSVHVTGVRLNGENVAERILETD